MINTIFYFTDTQQEYLDNYAQGSVKPHTICFAKDTKTIWRDGQRFTGMLQNEVESILDNSRKIINNIDTYKQNITDCEEILKQLNPQFAKDKERDDRLFNLESRFDGVESKLDKIFDLIKK